MARRNTRSKQRARKPRAAPQRAGRPAESLAIPWPVPKCGLAEAVSLVAQHADRSFTLAEAVTAIQRHARIRNPEPRAHIRSLLSETADLARIPEEERYLPGRHLFRDAAFYIAPTALELAEGVLVPGHRFYPFMSEAVAPNEVVLSTEDGTVFPKKTLVRPLSELIIYHTLIGIQDMLLLCRPVDENSLRSPDALPDAPVEIEVYDLSAFYKTHAFAERDLILVRVQDYATGAFQLTHANAQIRFSLQRDTVARDAGIEAALIDLMEEFGPEPPCRLLRDAYARLFQDEEDLSKPAGAFGQFLLKSKRVTLADYHYRPCLVPRGEDPIDYYDVFPASAYDGRCETLEDMFGKGNLSLDMPYVRAAILDDVDHEGAGREAVVERLMKGRSIPQWDEEDWAFFREEFGKLWEEVQGRRRELSPNRKVKAFRRKILEQCDRHLAFLRRMDGMGLLPEELPLQEMAGIAGLDSLYGHLLQILETPLDGTALRTMEKQFTAIQESGDALYADFEKALEFEVEEDDEDDDGMDLADWEDEEREAGAEFEGPLTVYVLKVKFKHAKRIWRKIEIAGSQTLDDLHWAIQNALGWGDEHLYSFFMSNRAWDRASEFASPDAEDAPGADRMRIADLALKLKRKFLYLFDYGDEHEFEIEVVGIRTDAEGGRYPKMIEGRGEVPDQYPEWE